ncbi:hypothetical protein H5410_016368 [Solanum commersonii]|uniref:WD-repeat protein n=1 Tax=Solanum commersonii TaxID=4109 RepID=A0A9J5ZWE7_SOLCO|nr:hypothetical protein H5410_016368 [Solanum commersonii]
MEFTEAYKQTGSYAFSPNARFLAVAVDYRLVIRDVLSLKKFHKIGQFQQHFNLIALLNQYMSPEFDLTIMLIMRLWKKLTHSMEVMSAERSTMYQASELAICDSYSKERAVLLNEYARSVVQLFSCLDKITYIEWAPDSEYILCGLYKKPMIQAWSLTQPEWTCKIDEGPAGVAYARWSPDSRHILTTSDFQLRLTVWSLVNTACIHVQWPKHGSKGVSFTKDGKFAAICTRRDCKDYVNLLSCHTWEIMGVFAVDTLDLADVQWSADDSAIVIWDSPLEYKVLIYSPDGRCLAKYQAYESGLGVKSVSWSPCSQFLAVGSYDQMLRVLNHLTWKVFAEFVHPSAVRGPCCAAIFKEVDEQLDMSELSLGDDFVQYSSGEIGLGTKIFGTKVGVTSVVDKIREAKLRWFKLALGALSFHAQGIPTKGPRAVVPLVVLEAVAMLLEALSLNAQGIFTRGSKSRGQDYWPWSLSWTLRQQLHEASHEPWSRPLVWFGLGTSMLEVSSSKPLASESKGFAFWVELVAPGLPSASYLSYVERKFYPVRIQRVAAVGFPCHHQKTILLASRQIFRDEILPPSKDLPPFYSLGHSLTTLTLEVESSLQTEQPFLSRDKTNCPSMVGSAFLSGSLAEMENNASEAHIQVRYNVLEVPINLPSQKPPADKPNPKQGISLMSWSSDSQFICTRNDSIPTVLWIWDINHLELAAILVQKDPIRAAVWDPTCPRLVLCTGSPHIYMWTPSGAYCINVPLPQFAVIDLKWNSDGSCLFLKDKESFCCASPEILQESSDYSSDD